MLSSQQPDPRPPTPELRRHDARWTWIVWAVLVLLTLMIAGLQGYRIANPPTADMAGSRLAAERKIEPPDPQQVLLGRMALGYHDLSGGVAAGGQGVDQFVDELRDLDDPAAGLRAAIVVAEVEGPAAALAELDELLTRDDLPEAVRRDAATLHELYAPPPPAPRTAQPRTLVTDDFASRHGWFGELARTYPLPDANTARRSVRAAAVRSVWAFLTAVMLAVGAGAVGLVLLVVAVVLLALGRIRSHLRPPRVTGPFAEAGALYLGSFLVIAGVGLAVGRAWSVGGEEAGDVGGAGVPRWLVAGLILLQFLAVPLAVAWPLARGVGWRDWRAAFGITRGGGVGREIASGLVGYLAGLPIMALGMLITAGLIRLGAPHFEGGHPIMEQMAGASGRQLTLLLLLAAVHAPLTEELLFRGAMFASLRGRGWHASASAVVVGLVFALVHPQGLAAVPALTAIALVFAAIREWRGSLIGPVVAHGVHNGTLMVMVYLLMV